MIINFNCDYDHDYDLLGTDSIHADITQGYPGLHIVIPIQR